MDAITELNNKNHSQGDDTVSTETISLSEHNKTIVELNGKVTVIQGKLDAVEAQNVELNAKIETLETEKAEIEKAKVNEKLFNDGHINKAQLVALNEGKGMLEVLALNTVMNTEAKGVDTKENKTVELNAKEQEMADALGLTAEEFVKFNK
jgi:phage I-like protein